MSKLTPVFGGYYNTISISDSLYFDQADAGVGTTNEGTDLPRWQYIEASHTGKSWNQRYVGEFNWQGFSDHNKLDAAAQLRYQDVLQVVVSGGGGDVFAAVGFFSAPASEVDPRLFQGFMWALLDDGYWHCLLTAYDRHEKPTQILRRTATTLLGTEENFLGLVADGETRTLYWLADNDVVDFYTVNEFIGGGSAQPYWAIRIGVDNDDAKLRFAGGGDAYIVAVGEIESTDLGVETLAKPTITIFDYGATWAELRGSAFSHTGDAEHLASQWQIALNADSTFASPVVDSEWDCRNLLAYHTGGVLEASTAYRARVRYIADDGVISDWSDPATFTTEAEDTEVDTPWSNDGAICLPGETEPNTPWTKPAC